MIDKCIKDYLAYIDLERGYSKATCTKYKADIESLRNFMNKEKIIFFTELKHQDIINFIQEQRQTLSHNSVKLKVIVLDTFFKFLKREFYLEHNIFDLVQVGRKEQRIVDVLTPCEVEKLLRQPEKSHRIGCRDWAIMETLYSTGIRVSELCDLSLDSIEDGMIKVNGKGSKERIVPIGAQALKAIIRYAAFRDAFPNLDNCLFVTTRGNKLNRVEVWRMIKKYALKSKINKKIGPHTLRHSYATHLYQNGADIRVIQALLGHRDIGSTDRYTHVTFEDLQEKFNKFSPKRQHASM